jgi:signal transduction histidine kinase
MTSPVTKAEPVNSSTLKLEQRLTNAHPHWWLGAMLLTLHYALAWGITDWLARAMLLAHFGLFLMWQPVWRGERSIEARHGYLVIVAGVVLAWLGNWWLMATWIAVLFALIGGNVLGNQEPRQRLAALAAAVYLLSLLFMWVVPQLFVDQRIDPLLTLMVQYGLQVLPALIIVMPLPAGSKSSRMALDLFYSLMLFLLVAGLVLGSFVVKQVSQGNYAIALAQTLIVMALLLMTLSWLWNPRSGFTGIGHLLSRYLLSLGMPFERWVKGLADLAERERDSSRFLSLALNNMSELPWIAGLTWQAPYDSGKVGVRTAFQAEHTLLDFKLTYYTKWSLSPALLLHLKLLTQMLGHFYQAKQREETQRQNAYTQAIHETGARLTHDVKNLLQSLRSLCAAAETSSADEAAALQELIRRQLPQIAQRLSTTLEKLKAPQPGAVVAVDAAGWWDGLKQRYRRAEVVFADNTIEPGTNLPGELFDSVAENLLQNAIAKAQQHADIRINVVFDAANGGSLSVCDTGHAVPKAVADHLLGAPVPSQSGLGIGLFQAAKQAAPLGYTLELTSNAEGKVCFTLARADASG